MMVERALKISEANMEEGQMRCDINISVNTEEKEGNNIEREIKMKVVGN